MVAELNLDMSFITKIKLQLKCHRHIKTKKNKTKECLMNGNEMEIGFNISD